MRKNCIATWFHALIVQHLDIVIMPMRASGLFPSTYKLVGFERDCEAMCLFVPAVLILAVDDVHVSAGTFLLRTCVHLRRHEGSRQHHWQELW